LPTALQEFLHFPRKGNAIRWQPITPALVNCLADHATARGAVLPTSTKPPFRTTETTG
jgi:hypothetical protein